MKISCAIVDDEPLGRQIIREYLQNHPDLEITIDCGDPQEAYQHISAQPPDILFLDIQMPQINGFELLEMLDRKPITIFCTAYDAYAIEAFKANAVDYLLKPFEQKRLDQALTKARGYLSQRQSTPQLENLLSHIQASPQQVLDRIVVRKNNYLKPIMVADVYWLEALEDYVRIYTATENYLVVHRLGDLEKRLPKPPFARIHRSHIVNLDAIQEIHPWSSGRYLLKLKNGQEIETSKSGAKIIKEMVL